MRRKLQEKTDSLCIPLAIEECMPCRRVRMFFLCASLLNRSAASSFGERHVYPDRVKGGHTNPQNAYSPFMLTGCILESNRFVFTTVFRRKIMGRTLGRTLGGRTAEYDRSRSATSCQFSKGQVGARDGAILSCMKTKTPAAAFLPWPASLFFEKSRAGE